MVWSKLGQIELVPWNEPLEHRLQALAAAAWFVMFTIGGYIILILFTYLMLTTCLWCIILPYFCWIYFDRGTPEKGGRVNKWVQHWAWFRYLKNYFQVELVTDPNLRLDTKKNYLFCCFPHGTIPAGPFNAIVLDHSKFQALFPQFKVKTAILGLVFYLPITRDLALNVGCISASAKSLTHIFTKTGGGNIVNLFVGGAAEASLVAPEKYTFIVKRRKGFVKLALKTGASLVPVITFGENDLFGHVRHPLLEKVQEFIRRQFGFLPAVVVGRGFFQKSFGLIPRQKPLTTVVGKALDVEKVDCPTDLEVEVLHKKFVDDLVKLFETYKPEKLTLELI